MEASGGGMELEGFVRSGETPGKKKIAIYGNCQAPSLAAMLRRCSSFREKFNVIRWEAVHAISEQEQLKCLQEVAPELDVLVYQPVRDKYRGSAIFGAEHVKGHLPRHAVTISFPSLHFAGYYPGAAKFRTVTPEVAVFCRQEFGTAAAELFHYRQIANSYLRGRDVEAAVRAFDEGETDDAKRALATTIKTVRRMRTTEERFGIDIPMSDFISNNFSERMLYHSPVHPGSEVLTRVCRLILEILGLKATTEEVERIKRLDPLALVDYPLQNYVSRALNLRFSAPAYYESKTTFMTKGEMVEKYYALYAMFTPKIWGVIQRKFFDKPPLEVGRGGSESLAEVSSET
jgi:hypothetical protein